MIINVSDKSYKYIRYGINLLIVLYCCVCYSVWLLDKTALWEVATEDHIIENVATIYLFFCALLFFTVFILSKHGKKGEEGRHKKNFWFLFLGIIFLFGVGEEISWGQSFFNITVPEKLKQINTQEELNIHNIIYFNPRDFEGIKKPFRQQFFTFNGAYIIFGLGFCFLIPLFHLVSNSCSRWLKYIRVPLVPFEIGVIFVTTCLINKVVNSILVDEDLRYPNEEIREHIWAFLFLVVAIRWLINQIQARIKVDMEKRRTMSKNLKV